VDKKNGKIILFGLGLLLGILVAGLIVLVMSNIGGEKEESTITTAQELISDEELPIVAEGEQAQGTEQYPFFETPETMEQASTESTIYKFVQTQEYSNEDKLEFLKSVFGEGKYEKKEEREEATTYESKEKNKLQAIVISNSLLGYWTYYQPDNNPVSCFTNGGDEPCPTTVEEAEKEAKKLLKKFFPEEKYAINSYEGGGVYNIIVSPLLDGVETSPPFVFEYSPNGQLIYATGYFAELEPQNTVSVLNPKTVLNKLNDSVVWSPYLIEQTSIPTAEYASGDVNNRDAEDGTRVFIDKGIPGWKTYMSDQLSDVYLVPSYIIVPSGKNRAWNVIAIDEQDLPNMTKQP
jgi:hypothetical protein